MHKAPKEVASGPAAILHQCPVCSNHYKLRSDGKLCRHGGKFKGGECPGSFKAPGDLGYVAAQKEITEGSKSVPVNVSDQRTSPVPLVDRYETIFANLAKKLKCLKIHEHVPKPCREVVANYLSALLFDVGEDPYNLDHWIRLICFFPYVLMKPPRGGRRVNTANLVIKKLNMFKTINVDSLPNQFEIPHGDREMARKRGGMNWASAITNKIEQGNLKSAVQLLCSAEGLAVDSPDTLSSLRDIHPKAPLNRRAFPSPELTKAVVSPNYVLKALKSFNNGSSGGLDGLRPQHLKDSIASPIHTDGLLLAITEFINLLVNGICPPLVVPFMFGGRLVALTKKGGGVRPIAVGNVWRRLASKCALSLVLEGVKLLLHPLQLGVGARGGVEAAVHSVRGVVENLPNNWSFLKIDFKNAFNNLRRDSLLEAVKQHCPSIFNYCLLAYGQTTELGYQDHVIESCEGVQQGDPLGPLLFAITIHPLLTRLSSVFRCGYLDDLSLASEVGTVANDYIALKTEALALGLPLNVKKCEVFAGDPNILLGQPDLGEVPCIPLLSLSFLGAPIMAGTFHQLFLKGKLDEMKFALSRLPQLPSHDSLTILRHALYVPKLMFFLRTSPIQDMTVLHEFDETVRNTFSVIFNVEMTDLGWVQAQLPVRLGGIGLSSVVQLAPIAFQSSAAATFDLQSAILGRFHEVQGLFISNAIPPVPQHIVTENLNKLLYQDLVQSSGNPANTARLLAITSEVSCGWLRSWPNTSLGTRLDDETVRTSIALRLGLKIHNVYQCRCGESAIELGYHGLACRLGGGRQLRHSAINDYICRLFSKASIPITKEPSGISSVDGKRPDGCTMIPWKSGKCLAWDVTIPDTMAVRYLPLTSLQSGTAATRASDDKFKKYSGAINSMHFLPICIEAFGPTDATTCNFFDEICALVSKRSGDQRERLFIMNYVSCLLQKMNCFCIRDNNNMNTDQRE